MKHQTLSTKGQSVRPVYMRKKRRSVVVVRSNTQREKKNSNKKCLRQRVLVLFLTSTGILRNVQIPPSSSGLKKEYSSRTLSNSRVLVVSNVFANIKWKKNIIGISVVNDAVQGFVRSQSSQSAVRQEFLHSSRQLTTFIDKRIDRRTENPGLAIWSCEHCDRDSLK